MDAAREAELVEAAPISALPADGALVIPAVNAAAVRTRRGKRELPHIVERYVEDGRYVDVELTTREHALVCRMVETFNVHAVAAEFGMHPRTVQNFLKRPRIKALTAARISERAGKQSLTIDKVLCKLNGAIDGVQPMDEQQLAACGVAARILRPTAPSSITLQQQNNFGAPGGARSSQPSPYAKMGRDELLSEMRETLAETDVVESGPVADPLPTEKIA